MTTLLHLLEARGYSKNSAASPIFSRLVLSHAPTLLMNHLPILPARQLSVFFIDFRARRQHHSSSAKPAFDVWSRTSAFASSPEVHFVARSEIVPRVCFLLEMLSSVVLRCVPSATHLWLCPSLADVPESSDPEFRCRCRRMIDPGSANVPVPTVPERNLEPAPSHYVPTQQLPTLRWVSDQASPVRFSSSCLSQFQWYFL